MRQFNGHNDARIKRVKSQILDDAENAGTRESAYDGQPDSAPGRQSAKVRAPAQTRSPLEPSQKQQRTRKDIV